MSTTLEVLTLNCWGLPVPIFGSVHREERMNAIATSLLNANWDIVALQEVWDYEDYEKIREKVSAKLPGAYYFHSGMIGSGVCIFTKGQILFTMPYRYTLNGYPHHIHRGDWFCGKAAGLARVKLGNLVIDVYATHLHAEYDREKDLYLPHRVLQAFELSQFIRGTSVSDIAIVLGDLNLEPSDLGFRLIISNAKLTDAYECRQDKTVSQGCEPNGYTNGAPSNSFTRPKERGKRIDYILYRSNQNFHIDCLQCHTTMGRIPCNMSISYSDHEALCATLQLQHGGAAVRQSDDMDMDIVVEAKRQMIAGIEEASSQLKSYTSLLLICVVAFIATIFIEVAFEIRACTVWMLIARFILTILIAFFGLYGIVGMRMERKALMAAWDGMNTLQNARQAFT